MIAKTRHKGSRSLFGFSKEAECLQFQTGQVPGVNCREQNEIEQFAARASNCSAPFDGSGVKVCVCSESTNIIIRLFRMADRS